MPKDDFIDFCFHAIPMIMSLNWDTSITAARMLELCCEKSSYLDKKSFDLVLNVVKGKFDNSCPADNDLLDCITETVERIL